MFDKYKIKIISLLLIFILLPVELFGITMNFCQKLDNNHNIMLELKGKCCMEMQFAGTLNQDKNHSQNLKDICCKNLKYKISNVIESNKIDKDQFKSFRIETIIKNKKPAQVFPTEILDLISFEIFSPPFIKNNTIIQLI